MEKLNINLENCYGIKKMVASLDFTKKTHIIYSSNGTMKSSFAQVFKDVSNKESSKDRIFTERLTKREIFDENGLELNPKNIFVIDPSEEAFTSEKVSTLLVNEELKKEYDQIFLVLDKKLNALISKIGSSAGTKSSTLSKFANSFSKGEDNIFELLEEIKEKLPNAVKIPTKIKYNDFFHQKVKNFMGKEEIRKQIDEYVKKYGQLVSESKYFKKDIFTHNEAENISKNLEANGFFKAEHSVIFRENSGDSREERINNQQKLDEIIKEEKERILNNPELKEQFEKIDKILNNNFELRTFRKCLMSHPELIPLMKDFDEFEKNTWIFYIKENKKEYDDLMEEYFDSKPKIERILGKAEEQKTEWEEVVELFNKRFIVPFDIKISNQKDAILKITYPNTIFEYDDPPEHKTIGEDEIMSILSSGEQRALYLLNILFEIRVLEKKGEECILIIDDIADSFDYKNKYAIIEYLKEISEKNLFNMIILTHNFDFYRCLKNRLGLNRKSNCHMTIKDSAEIKLCDVEYLNPFNYWKNNLSQDKCLIASIPFLRNILEYTKGSGSQEYLDLVSMLHIKQHSNQIKISDLEQIWNSKFNKSPNSQNSSEIVMKKIFSLAEDILIESSGGINLENKIILSIAIRLMAEKFTLSKITDITAISQITKNQTYELFDLFQKEFPQEIESIEILKKVNLMTPENIHLNSFMYEPILDLSEDHLKNLYNEVKSL